MRFKLLAEKSLDNERVVWRLAMCNLYDYLSNLKKDFFDFDVQRRIVSNSYLDKIGESILGGEPLPAFTLTSYDVEDSELNLDKTDILDGLQRTYRLWVIIFLERMITEHGTSDFERLYEKIKESDEGKKLIAVKLINRSRVREYVDNDCEKIKKQINAYKDFEIIINIWTGLTEQEVIKKMLTLNAGQRSVSSTHQFELMFLHCFKNPLKSGDINIIREKDSDYNKVRRGDRNLGDYLMSSIIIALQSYIEQQPLRISQVNKLRIEDSVIPESSSDFFSDQKLHQFIELISQIDVKTINDSDLNRWLMKDTTLSGLFAAMGVLTDSSVDLRDKVINDCIKKINRDNIDVNEFETNYQRLSSVSTNVGNAVRKAAFHYFLALFKDSKISWREAFNNPRYVQI